MRIWSIHPKYLDTKRLTAQWREALLCKSIIEGKTKSYTKHPQYLRLLQSENPYQFINAFLLTIWEESQDRGFNYNKSKINIDEAILFGKNINDYIEVSKNQLKYEFCHMLQKIETTSIQYIKNMNYYNNSQIIENPMFIKTDGDIMTLEIVKHSTMEIFKKLNIK